MGRLAWITVVVLYATSIFFFAGTSGFRPGAASFPRTLAVMLFVLTSLWALSLVRGEVQRGTSPGEGYPWRGWAAMGLLFVYALLTPVLGFSLATVLAMIALMLLLGQRDGRLIGATAILWTLLLYVGFDVVLGVPVPKGLLGF